MILVLVTTIALALFFNKLRNCFNYWKRLKVPYVKPLPLVGNCLDLVLMKKSIPIFIRKLCDKMKHKPIFGIWFLTEPCLVIQDFEIIKTIMIKDYNCFTDRGVHFSPNIDPNFNLGILFLPQPYWKDIRSKLSPSFTPSKSKKFFELIVEKANKMIDYINLHKLGSNNRNERLSSQKINNVKDESKKNKDAHSKNNGQDHISNKVNGNKKLTEKSLESHNNIKTSSKKKILEMYDLSKIFTTECIMSSFFGLDMNGFNENFNPIKELANQMFEATFSNILRQSLYFFNGPLIDIFQIPFVPKALSKQLKDYLVFSLRERKKSGRQVGDFIDEILKLQSEIDEDILLAQPLSFFTAGLVTSNASISFALHELSCNLECQERARNEIRAILEKYELSCETLQKMKYLDAVMMETMRKYPALPFLDRRSTKDYTFPKDSFKMSTKDSKLSQNELNSEMEDFKFSSKDLKSFVGDIKPTENNVEDSKNEFMLRKGSKIIIPLMGVNYNPDYFPEPDRFNPDRFLEKDKCKNEVANPFGLGPRLCLGKQFAELMVKIGLVVLLSEFEFERCPDTRYPIAFSKKTMFLESENKIPLYVKKIS